MLYSKTPLIKSFPLSKRLDKNIYLKLENLQPSGSFKLRGIEKVCKTAKAQGIKHFVSSSAGNAGYSAAYVAYHLDIEITVFVPENTSKKVLNILNSVNANVEEIGASWDETHKAAMAFNDKIGGRYIHPFDDELLWQGHASMIDEAASDMVKPDAILLSIGGGGMLSGVVQGMDSNNWSDVPVITIETQGADSFHQAIQQNERIRLDKFDSVAKSLGAMQVCVNAFDISKRENIHSVVVRDKDATDACYNFSQDHRFLVEPACGATLSLAYLNHPILEHKKNILIIVCGGILSGAVDIAGWAN